MARQAATGTGGNGNSTSHTATVTIAGTNRLSYIALMYRHNTVALNTVDYGSGNTIYNSAGDTSRLIAQVVTNTTHELMIFRIFDAAHPANGSVTITASFASNVRCCVMVVQYDDADQTTGHRGTPVTGTADTGTAWDLTSISSDTSDQETVGFCGALDGNQSHTEDADNPELIEVSSGGAAADRAVIVADTTSRSTLGGDWSASNGFAAWGASALPLPATKRQKFLVSSGPRSVPTSDAFRRRGI